MAMFLIRRLLGRSTTKAPQPKPKKDSGLWTCFRSCFTKKSSHIDDDQYKENSLSNQGGEQWTDCKNDTCDLKLTASKESISLQEYPDSLESVEISDDENINLYKFEYQKVIDHLNTKNWIEDLYNNVLNTEFVFYQDIDDTLEGVTYSSKDFDLFLMCEDNLLICLGF